MEKTGSINNILYAIDKLSENDIVKTGSKVILDENKLFKVVTTELRSFSKSKDIVGILNCERAMLKYELAKCQDTSVDKGRVTSLTTAVRDLDNARILLDDVFNSEKYHNINAGYSAQKIDRTKDGLPKDAFHRFIDSHKTRLGNRLIGDDGSFEKRNLLKTRHESMSLLKQEYMVLQAKILNIHQPAKTKEHERER